MKDWKTIYQYVLGAVIVLCFFAVIVLMVLKANELRGNDNQVIYAMVGTLGTIAVMVATYFFGSSKGSSDKNEMLKK